MSTASWTDPCSTPAEPTPPPPKTVQPLAPRTPCPPASGPAEPPAPADGGVRSGHGRGHDKQPDDGSGDRPDAPAAPELSVFAGAGEDALDTRTRTLLAAAHQLAGVHAAMLVVAATTLARFDHAGPRAKIWRYPLPRRAGPLGSYSLADLAVAAKPTAHSGLPAQIKP